MRKLRQENETKPNSLSKLQPAGESQDFISPNQGHLRANGLCLSSLTREHTASLAINHRCPGKRGMLKQMEGEPRTKGVHLGRGCTTHLSAPFPLTPKRNSTSALPLKFPPSKFPSFPCINLFIFLKAISFIYF